MSNTIYPNSNSLDYSKLPDWLVPVVVQDVKTKLVLMVGFMNQEAYTKTIQEGKVTFRSRTKKRLRTKGEESGNFLMLKNIFIDCDKDAVLILAKPVWPTCHVKVPDPKNTENKVFQYSCFGSQDVLQSQCDQSELTGIDFIPYLYDFLRERKINPKEWSFTSELFAKWLSRIAKKFGEESVEVVIAALVDKYEWSEARDGKFMEESADLLFFFLMLCIEKDISLDHIIQVLKERHTPNK